MSSKTGRPPFQFSEKDIRQIRVLARCHCPDSEIAAFVGCSEKTLQRRHGELLKLAREAGKANIRRKQYQLAMEGDKTMLIWLGKQLLGQREKTEVNVKDLTDDQLATVIRGRLDHDAGKS